MSHPLGSRRSSSAQRCSARASATQRLGTLDTLLTKPVSPWAYMVFSGLNPGYTGHVLLGIAMMAWALTIVPIAWSPGWFAYFILALISAGMVTGAILTMIGATAMIWTRSNHLYALFFGFWELSRYPITIFPVAIQATMLTIVPLGFMAAVPVVVLYILAQRFVVQGLGAGAVKG